MHKDTKICYLRFDISTFGFKAPPYLSPSYFVIFFTVVINFSNFFYLVFNVILLHSYLQEGLRAQWHKDKAGGRCLTGAEIFLLEYWAESKILRYIK